MHEASSGRWVYNEPTVMWRMRRAGGLFSHAVVGPCPGGATVIWFVNDRAVGYREFADWTNAIRWSDQLKAQNWAAGWRLTPAHDESL